MTCRQAGKDEIYPAMRLILGTGGKLATDEQVVDFLRYALARGIDTNGVWVAERGGEVAFAILPVPNPGRTMLLLTPGELREAQEDVAGMLIEAIAGRAGESGMNLAQVLLEPTDSSVVKVYAEHAFQHLAELIYLQGNIRRTVSEPELPDDYNWTRYSEASHGRFAAAIAASYQQSLDCPALTGMRNIEDTVAGHRAAGEFDPELWFLLSEGDEARGVLLLSPVNHAEAMELVYLGLVPGARGKGIGDVLMRQALATTARRKLSMLTLAVDSRNAPALKLYFRHGMHRVASKVAMMRDLRKGKTSQGDASASGTRAEEASREGDLSTRIPQGR